MIHQVKRGRAFDRGSRGVRPPLLGAVRWGTDGDQHPGSDAALRLTYGPALEISAGGGRLLVKPNAVGSGVCIGVDLHDFPRTLLRALRRMLGVR
jgi:hypothetical protein